jgi:hypothetical protein
VNPSDIAEVVGKISELLEPTAQQVWDIAHRQAVTAGRVDAWIGAVVSVICLASIVFFIKLWNEAELDCAVGTLLLAVLPTGVVGTALLANGIMRLSNPAWYTIELLKGLL